MNLLEARQGDLVSILLWIKGLLEISLNRIGSKSEDVSQLRVTLENSRPHEFSMKKDKHYAPGNDFGILMISKQDQIEDMCQSTIAATPIYCDGPKKGDR